MEATRNEAEPRRAWFRLEVHPWVFFTSAGLIIGTVVLTILFDRAVDDAFSVAQAAISKYTGWFFVWTMNIMLVFALMMLLGRFGDIRLGGDDAEPDFSTPAWFAMLFSAGMGIGLLFYGVAEPMFHYVASPLAEPATTAAARLAMDLTFLHWGLHPWAVYAVVGLALGFFAFNKGLPLSIRSIFHPLLGERIHGPIGNLIDILATVATLFGVATSLGLGVQQVNAGLDHLFAIGQSAGIQMSLIAAITAAATWSVVAGLDSGIKRLSALNIYLAAGLMVFVLVLGPTLFVLKGLLENIGFYLQHLPQYATWNETYENSDWQSSWTVFYWGWWISWSPFVGMFIARVSYGRTIRAFVAGVLVVPTLVTFLWITVFGGSALQIEMFGAGGIAKAVQENIPVSLFVLLEHFPLAGVTSVLAILVVITFFITSSDSGSLVIDIITAGGNTEPPVLQRVFWAVLEGVVAASLLAGGGLVALQTAAVSTGLPFAAVLIVMCVSLHRGLAEYKDGQAIEVATPRTSVTRAFRTRGTPPLPSFGRRRLW